MYIVSILLIAFHLLSEISINGLPLEKATDVGEDLQFIFNWFYSALDIMTILYYTLIFNYLEHK